MNPAENYILKKPEPFKSILLHLQVIIEHTIKDIDLTYKWSLPCYWYKEHSGFCYLNQTKNYVDLVFWRSAYLDVYPEYLKPYGRKALKSLRYYKQEDINEDVLIEILLEADGHKEKSFYK